MAKRRVPGTYGFTTTPGQLSLARIAREAKDADRFIISKIRDTKHGSDSVAVLIRKDVLPHAREGVKIFDRVLGKTSWGQAAGDFRAHVYVSADGHKLYNKIKTDIQHLRNLVEGRVLRVQVEAIQ